MAPTHPPERRRRATLPTTEVLEGRELLTGTAGDTFALLQGQVVKAGRNVAVKFTIDPANFTLKNGRMELGIDVAAATGSGVKPVVASVVNENGQVVRRVSATNHVSTVGGSNSTGTVATLTPVHVGPHHLGEPVVYTVNIRGVQRSTGNFLVGFYLPGDANGDGKVNTTDVQAVTSAYRSYSGSSQYSFDADANRDGKIGLLDLKFTRKNQGVATTISPNLTTNLDETNAVVAGSRVLTQPFAHFTGTLSPNAVIKFIDASKRNQPVATVADSSGNYSIIVPLSVGDNTFQISTLDTFGQSITGLLSPVSYQGTSSLSTSSFMA